MHTNRLIPMFSALIPAAMLAGALTLTGCAPTATASTARPAAARGNANIMLYSINSDGPDFRAVITGAIGDYGPAQAVYPDGKVDSSHSSEMELRLTRGSFRLNITGIDQKFAENASHQPIYPATCSNLNTFTATAPIVPGSGTGSYRRISGSFIITVTGDEVSKRPCPGSGFLWNVIVLAGPGTISPG